MRPAASVSALARPPPLFATIGMCESVAYDTDANSDEVRER
jgi:hypothetical protein